MKLNYKENHFQWTKVVNFNSSRPEVFCKKDVLANFAKLTGKHLCQGLFFYSYMLFHIMRNKFQESGGECNKVVSVSVMSFPSFSSCYIYL